MAAFHLRGSKFLLRLRSQQLSSDSALTVPDFGQEVSIGVAMKDDLRRLRHTALNGVHRNKQATGAILGTGYAKGPVRGASYKVTSRRQMVIADKK